MVATPNTLGVVVLFVVTFLGCILWATHGDTGTHHHGEEEDLQATGKSS